MLLQPGISVGSPVDNAAWVAGRCVARHERSLRGGYVGGELLVEGIRSDHKLAASGAQGVRGEGVAQCAAREPGGQVERRLAMVGSERVDVHERDDGVIVGGGLGNDHAAVGMGHEHDRSFDRAKDVAHVGGVAGEIAERVGDGDDVELQLCGVTSVVVWW